MTERPYDVVLCDIDGVLRHHGDTLARAEQSHGFPPGALAAAAFAPDRLLPAITGKVSDQEWRRLIAADLAERFGSRERAAAAVTLWSDAHGQIDEIARELLVRTRRRVPVLLVSNGTTRLERDLDALGVTGDVDGVVNSARVGAAKPDQAIFAAAAERAGAAPERCLFVDDAIANVKAARGYGMTGVLHTGPEDLRTALAPLL